MLDLLLLHLDVFHTLYIKERTAIVPALVSTMGFFSLYTSRAHMQHQISQLSGREGKKDRLLHITLRGHP